MNKITRRAFLVFFAITLSWTVLALEKSTTTKPFRQDQLSIQSNGKVFDFSIEIAETQSQRELGLMHRTQIPADHGMLFIWSKDVPGTMWMKDTPSSLDMIFIDQHGKIVSIAEKTTPFSEDIISPKQLVRGVIEFPAGTISKKGIKVGDRVMHSYFKP